MSKGLDAFKEIKEEFFKEITYEISPDVVKLLEKKEQRSKELEKLALIQKVFEKLADWNAYDLAKLDKDYETNFDLDFLEIEKALKEHEQYKAIEKELSIDIPKLISALKNGIWLKGRKDQFIPYRCLLRDDFVLVLYEDIYKEEYLLEDYGKTWALTREELE